MMRIVEPRFLLLVALALVANAAAPQVGIPAPAPRDGHEVAHVLQSRTLLLFGGQSGTRYLNDTWEWIGYRWTQVLTQHAPPPRSDFAMAQDRPAGNVILFGGTNGTTPLGDTWRWNGTDWTLLNPTASPSAREGHTMAFDPKRGRLVLFGGYDPKSKSALADTWEWDGTNWKHIATATTPPARTGHAMIFDPGAAKIVLFGGTTGTKELGDTWAWDGSKWALLGNSGPAARHGHGMAYDANRSRVVLFGGETGSFTLNDTWERDTTGWKQVYPTTTPLDRRGHAAAYDSWTGGVLVHGGWQKALGHLGNLDRWTGTTWVQQHQSSLPPNLALGKSATASSYRTGAEPAAAFDGNPLTAWNAGTGPPAWIQVDLGSRQQLGRVNLAVGSTPDSEAARQVLVSDDGAKFTTIATVKHFSYEHSYHAIDLQQPASGRYVRIVTTKSLSWVALWEAEVLPPLPTPTPVALLHGGSARWSNDLRIRIGGKAGHMYYLAVSFIGPACPAFRIPPYTGEFNLPAPVIIAGGLLDQNGQAAFTYARSIIPNGIELRFQALVFDPQQTTNGGFTNLFVVRY